MDERELLAGARALLDRIESLDACEFSRPAKRGAVSELLVKALEKTGHLIKEIDTQAALHAVCKLFESVSQIEFDSIPDRHRRVLKERLFQLQASVGTAIGASDNIAQPPFVFDPSDPDTVGKLIAATLLDQDRHRFSSLKPFYGSGVYAIYYTGDFAAYKPISGKDHPIYVGKSNPESADAATVEKQGTTLYARLLSDHGRSIRAAENLKIEDFECRFLVVRSAWQRTAEDYLIQQFKPVWNNESRICKGFGKHGDNHERRQHQRSPWDEIHPGRKWATKEGNTPNKRSSEEIAAEILRHLQSQGFT